LGVEKYKVKNLAKKLFINNFSDGSLNWKFRQKARNNQGNFKVGPGVEKIRCKNLRNLLRKRKFMN